MADLTDLAPVDFQLMIWGYCVTDCTPAKASLTRLNEATNVEKIRRQIAKGE